MTSALVSAADARYGKWLINLIGSIQRKSDIFDAMVVYDLGLTSFQRRLLEGVLDVEVRTVPPFISHWRSARTWKIWIWAHLEADTVVWLDAGVTVLRPLTDMLEGAEELGYFAVSTGVKTELSTPSEYYSLYDLPDDFGEQLSVTSGILAFKRSSAFFSQVIEPTFHDALLGRHLGFSAEEVTKLNWGLDKMEEVIVHDCPLFRYDQSLFNAHFYMSTPDPRIADLHKYGGFRSPHDHPEQVIWNHRRTGDYRFLPRVRYRLITAVYGTPWGTGVYLMGRWRNYRWVLRPSIHARVARRLLTTGRLRSHR